MAGKAMNERTEQALELNHFKVVCENVDQFLQPEPFRMGDCVCLETCKIQCQAACDLDCQTHCEDVCQVCPPEFP
jgi:hypothetical protein